ncbi:conserved hypothetical protein [Histoplasma capsulatum var. duboisii H88]|uniref:Uncharacterized protein n=4 Tax=Ajellomyces capsulatus TaxID=5037 RepID=C0NT94_AJECG|nr:uncharacterized protein HCBG_06374 [Histoplasma capsulatum G186AR]EER41022.1 conserved hypothetical protein [Histoplasma capsulatum H143]EGC46904.1 conserved hypothetical protein [Histoplasma capsulatum var. duboisii H88]KAG5305375.1 hypothetical protein I7I52_04011 [Histoplasma capsulatum]EEH05255.1 hypothetical protein HCBG_06374 [Histoplasma capsulatum G186AR]QSS53080.1 hypothetical protein I7I53_00229 [Histoplasma capsulatum var. duboisii H88]
MKTSIALLIAVAVSVMGRPTSETLSARCPPEGAPCGYYIDCCPGLTCKNYYFEGIGKCAPVDDCDDP